MGEAVVSNAEGSTVTRIVGSGLLMLLSLFMLVGFLRSDAILTAPATVVALLITVALPAAGSVALPRPARARGHRDHRLRGPRLRVPRRQVPAGEGAREGCP